MQIKVGPPREAFCGKGVGKLNWLSDKCPSPRSQLLKHCGKLKLRRERACMKVNKNMYGLEIKYLLPHE